MKESDVKDNQNETIDEGKHLISFVQCTYAKYKQLPESNKTSEIDDSSKQSSSNK